MSVNNKYINVTITPVFRLDSIPEPKQRRSQSSDNSN